SLGDHDGFTHIARLESPRCAGQRCRPRVDRACTIPNDIPLGSEIFGVDDPRRTVLVIGWDGLRERAETYDEQDPAQPYSPLRSFLTMFSDSHLPWTLQRSAFDASRSIEFLQPAPPAPHRAPDR